MTRWTIDATELALAFDLTVALWSRALDLSPRRNPSLEVYDWPVHAELASMIAVLEPRRALKDDPASDPVGDYEARGAVYTLSVAIRHEY